MTALALVRELPAFRRFWIGQSISLIGDQVSLLAIPLLAVLVLHVGAGTMGDLAAATTVPNLLFSIHVGAWVDRFAHRRQIMIAADLGRAALLATIPAGAALGWLTIAQLLIVGFLVGTLTVGFMIADANMIIALVPRNRYVDANQLLSGSRGLAFSVGPSLGGLLVGLLTVPLTLLADCASYLISALCLLRIEIDEPPPRQDRASAISGIRSLWRSRVLRYSLAATATINLFSFVFLALLVLYATRQLHVSPGPLGLVLGAGALGSVLGAALTGRLAARLGVGPTFVVGAILFPAATALVPLAGGPHLVILAMLFASQFLAGFGVMLLDICAGAIRQALVPAQLQARIAGAYNLVNYGVRPLGSLLGGALGASIGLRPTLWIAAFGGTLGGLILLASPAPQLQELPAVPETLDQDDTVVYH